MALQTAKKKTEKRVTQHLQLAKGTVRSMTLCQAPYLKVPHAEEASERLHQLPLMRVSTVPLYTPRIPASRYSCFAQSKEPLYLVSPVAAWI